MEPGWVARNRSSWLRQARTNNNNDDDDGYDDIRDNINDDDDDDDDINGFLENMMMDHCF